MKTFTMFRNILYFLIVFLWLAEKCDQACKNCSGVSCSVLEPCGECEATSGACVQFECVATFCVDPTEDGTASKVGGKG